MTVIDDFEEEFKQFTKANHAITCCNGTSALHTALTCVGVSHADLVITTPFSFISSANAILYCNAIPVFVDINPKTYCLDASLVEEYLKGNSDVDTILCVHLFGNTCDMSSLTSLSKRYGVHLIEDCAQALGAHIDGKHVGTFGDFGCFSFYSSKNLWTFEGGMLITNDDLLAEKARAFINHGRTSKNVHVTLGYNYRMPEICALIGLRMLQRHQKAILAELGSYGIKQGYYPKVIYHQPLYRKLGLTGDCPNAEMVAKQARRYLEK